MLDTFRLNTYSKTALSILSMLCLLAINGTTLFADEVRYYDFEIIVFENNDPQARLTEIWENTAQLEKPEKYIHLNSPYPGPMPSQFSPKHTFKRLPRSSYQLSQEAKLLTKNDKNKILLHTSWRQPGMSADTALPIHFKRNFISTTTVAEQPIISEADKPVAETSATVPTSELKQSKSVLEGYIKIILSRYLHADVDLTYTTGLPVATTTTLTAPAEPLNQEEDQIIETVRPPNVYHLQQTRKMRSKEVHYLDHPVVGFIILATPYLGKTLKAR